MGIGLFKKTLGRRARLKEAKEAKAYYRKNKGGEKGKDAQHHIGSSHVKSRLHFCSNTLRKSKIGRGGCCKNLGLGEGRGT